MQKLRVSRLAFAAVLALSSVFSLNIAPTVHAAGANCTWTGATSLNFNTASNWSNCNSGVPTTGDNLVFDLSSLSSSPTLNNNIVSLSVANVTFQGTSSNGYYFTLSGNPLTLTGNVSAPQGAVINNNIVLAGSPTLTGPATSGILSVTGDFSGTGNITTSGWVYLDGSSTATGTYTVNTGRARLAAGMGGAGRSLTVNDAAGVIIGACSTSDFTFASPITLNGAGPTQTGSFPPGKIAVGSICMGESGADEVYAAVPKIAGQDVTLSGAMTLGADATFAGVAETTTITGGLSGNFKLDVLAQYQGKLIVNSDSNSSKSPNATYEPGTFSTSLTDSQPGNTVLVGDNAVVSIDGTRSDTTVASGGKLMGSGTVGVLDVQTGGSVAPGHSPGCLNSGDLTLAGSYDFEIGGATACTGYDQINVTGTVDVTGGTLSASIYNNYKAAVGEKYVIVNNDGSDAVTGTFAGLVEGATFAVGDGQFRISYVGGDGNDIELTVLVVPSVPNTGFALLRAHPLATLLATLTSAGALLLIARRVRA